MLCVVRELKVSLRGNGTAHADRYRGAEGDVACIPTRFSLRACAVRRHGESLHI